MNRKWASEWRYALLLAAAWAAPAAALQTNVYYVDGTNGDGCAAPYMSWATAATNVQDAVEQAEAACDPGNGVFCEVVVADGVYVVTNQLVITKPIRLYSHSGDPATTALAGSYPAREHRVLHVTGEAWISGFTISNGYASGYAPDNYGGGVFMTTNGLGQAGLLTNCRVMRNQARQTPDSDYAYGCGVFLNDGGTLSNCLLRLNTSNKGRGGGVYINHNGTVMACEITDNDCSTAAVTKGGGVFLNDGGFVTNCMIARNVVRTGRGGVTFNSGGVMIDCVLTGHPNGPAVRFLNVGGRASHCIITNNLTGANYYQDGILEYSLVLNNNGAGIEASRASHIYNCIVGGNNGRGLTGDSRMLVRNTLVYGNVSDADGGGVKGATLENCTIVRNQAAQGGGVSTIGATSKNLIIYDNLATVESNNCYNVGGITYSCTTPLITGAGNTDADPSFYRPGSGYGPDAVAGDWRPRYHSSAAVNAGIYQTWMETARDLAGNPRMLPADGGVVDMGAYEAVPIPAGTIIRVR